MSEKDFGNEYLDSSSRLAPLLAITSAPLTSIEENNYKKVLTSLMTQLQRNECRNLFNFVDFFVLVTIGA